MPQKTKCEQEIDIFIRSRYPLIYIVSYEEQRILDMLSTFADERSKEIFVWSVTSGIRKYRDSKKVDEGTKKPMAALQYIEHQTFPALFILNDFHPFLTDATIIRKLRDMIGNLKNSYETLIIMAPVLKVPVELEKSIAVVEFDLPSKEDMYGLLNGIIEVMGDSNEVKIDVNDEIKEKLVNAALGLTLEEAENAFARSIVADKCLGPEDVERVLDEKEQVIRKSGILQYYHPQETINNVGGLDYFKEWSKKRALAFSDKAEAFGLPHPKGVLLIGVQGCGKSLTCKTLANLWQMPLLRFDVGRVFSGIMGSSEENMRRAIQTAESVAPVILWIDEIEKSLSGVESSHFSDAGTTARVFSTFLTWLQEKTKPVFVIATANNIKNLPPELLRKGRFDEIFFVDLPHTQERKEIFSIHIAKRKRTPDTFDLDHLAKVSPGFSGAEIEQAVISALFDAFVRGNDLKTYDIIHSIQSTVPLSQTMHEGIKELRDWARSRARRASSIEVENAEAI